MMVLPGGLPRVGRVNKKPRAQRATAVGADRMVRLRANASTGGSHLSVICEQLLAPFPNWESTGGCVGWRELSGRVRWPIPPRSEYKNFRNYAFHKPD